MSKHTTYRGKAIDMDSMRRNNEHVIALGNQKVNAKGDQLGMNGVITKTADQIARENHRVQSSVLQTGLKGPMPESPVSPIMEQPRREAVKPTVKKQKEVELPSGDIVMDDGSNDL